MLRFEQQGNADGVLGIFRSGYLTAMSLHTYCELQSSKSWEIRLLLRTLAVIRPTLFTFVLVCSSTNKDILMCLIKDQLRWRSDTYLDYLRDTPRLVWQHAASLAHHILYPDVSVKTICASLTPTSS